MMNSKKQKPIKFMGLALKWDAGRELWRCIDGPVWVHLYKVRGFWFCVWRFVDGGSGLFEFRAREFETRRGALQSIRYRVKKLKSALDGLEL